MLLAVLPRRIGPLPPPRSTQLGLASIRRCWRIFSLSLRADVVTDRPPRSSLSTMPRKAASGARTSRKESTLAENVPGQGVGVLVRRSSRRVSFNPAPSEDDSASRLSDDQQTSADNDNEPGRMTQDRNEVRQVIEGLVKMERRLRHATKKQKLKVEESDISIHEDRDHEKPVEPKKESGAGVEHAAVDGLEDNVDDPSESVQRGAAREPAVNSSYLPLPWTGRLGYACLNTYLRNAKIPIFSSRTCRMASIIDHRYPLQDPSQPEHATKNRPDKSKKSNVELGRKFVQDLGLANARDIIKMIRWNDRYGIKFMRLSSEMFPFASHAEHGYSLAPFASEVLAEAGKVIAELGHRVTTHPGQFTQLGSPRKEVITASVRDLIYHDEMLSLLKLPPQQNRDAVMILHMGGTYGDKAATLARFRENYTTLLSQSVKARLVLENDDVAWSVHDLLPICEELNIPLVLDYHHHNIIFDAEKCREGTFDISQAEITQSISNTWKRKSITQKMHYSEPRPEAVTPRDRRKHSPRVATLPPCPPGVDLMIEAKDKEQAVFELMRNFRLPGFEKINAMIPYEREDENKPPPKTPKKAKNSKKRKRTGDEVGLEISEEREEEPPKGIVVSAEDYSMGGPMNRVYWPPGMEEWLKPQKRTVKKDAVADAEE